MEDVGLKELSGIRQSALSPTRRDRLSEAAAGIGLSPWSPPLSSAVRVSREREFQMLKPSALNQRVGGSNASVGSIDIKGLEKLTNPFSVSVSDSWR
jgi:hypothetical protein